MIPKDVEDHIFYLRYGYTKQLAKIIKEEDEKLRKRRKKKSN